MSRLECALASFHEAFDLKERGDEEEDDACLGLERSSRPKAQEFRP